MASLDVQRRHELFPVLRVLANADSKILPADGYYLAIKDASFGSHLCDRVIYATARCAKITPYA